MKTASVLASKRTELVGCFFSAVERQMFTLADSSLLRFWCMNTGECVKSIILDKVDSIYETTGNPTEIFKQRPKI